MIITLLPLTHYKGENLAHTYVFYWPLFQSALENVCLIGERNYTIHMHTYTIFFKIKKNYNIPAKKCITVYIITDAAQVFLPICYDISWEL